MKKLGAALVLAAAASMATADDAEVLSAGLARLRLIPAYAMTTQAYDDRFKAVDPYVEGSAWLQGGAFEFGVTEAVTVGLWWTPGWAWRTDITNTPFDAVNDKMSAAGPHDLEVGVKVQVYRDPLFRLAATPHVSFPLDRYDSDQEFKNFLKGNEFRMDSNSRETLGGGLKLDADYLINEVFFINGHAAVFQYLPRTNTLFFTHLGNYNAFLEALNANGGNVAAAQTTAKAVAPIKKTTVRYGLDYTIELEPQAKVVLDDTTGFHFGLPIVFNGTTEGTTEINEIQDTIEETFVLTVEPSASVFTRLGPVPLEAEVKYPFPVLGRLRHEASMIQAQLRVYYQFY